MQNKGKTALDLSILSIFSLSIITASTSAIASALEVVCAYYSAIPYNTVYQLATVPSIVCMITQLLVGPFIGKKVTYKQVLVVGIILFIVGGMGPILFLNNFSVVMGLRVVFGIGLGMTNWGNAIIMAGYKGETRAKYLGYSSLVYTLFAMAIASATGILGDVSVYATFYIYALGVIPLVMILLMMKEPESTRLSMEAAKEAKQAGTSKEKKEKQKLSLGICGTTWFWMIFGGVVLLLKYPVYLQIGNFVVERGQGTAAAAGTAISLYTGAGALAALFYGRIEKVLKRYSIAFGMLCMVLNLVLVLFFNSLPLTLIGYALGGFGFTYQGLVRSNYIGAANDPSGMAMYVSINSIFVYGVMFLSTYYIPVANSLVSTFLGGESVTSNWWLCLVVYAIITVLLVVFDPRPKAFIEEQAQGES